MDKAIVFTFVSSDRALLAVDSLQRQGFESAEISVVFSDPDASASATRAAASEPGDRRSPGESAPPVEGAATGAGAGGVLGGGLGLVLGLGSLAVPGLGAIVAAGPIVAALSGAAVGAAVGGVTGALVGLGIAESEAGDLQSKLEAGQALVSVHSAEPSRRARAITILEQAGGHQA